MIWPPVKALTSNESINGQSHFVAINYGGKGPQRWVNLVSVLDGKSRLRVLWNELNNPSLWNSGWLQIPDEEIITDQDSISKLNEDVSDICLHPSNDSGLKIPSNSERPWFISQNKN